MLDLSKYDAAPTSAITETMRIRAQAGKQQILATNPTHPERALAPNRSTSTAKTWLFRWLAIPVAAAALIGLLVILPGGTGVAPAFASWTANPVDLTGAQLSIVNQACHEHFPLSIVNGLDASQPGAIDSYPKVAERRGDWAFLTYTSPTGNVGTCLARITDNRIEVAMAIAVPITRHWQTAGEFTVDGQAMGTFSTLVDGTSAEQSVMPSGWLGFSGLWGATDETYRMSLSWGRGGEPAPDSISTVVLAEGTVGEAGAFTAVSGRVGSEVAKIVAINAADEEVTPLIRDGYFTAWWPSVTRQLGNPVLRLTLTLNNGTVINY